MTDLKIATIQTHIFWEDTDKNLSFYESEYLNQLNQNQIDLVVLPELFSTGFTMNTNQFSEKMDGKTVNWMKNWAKNLNCIITGSVIIEENNQYYNRLLVVSGNGIESYYDKKHLFRMGDENNHFTAGKNRVIADIKGWKILLQVCYDLRFPVFSRNKTIGIKTEYDVIIYVANWPKIRSYAWETLLRARAIENQVFVIGVNRVGLDGNSVEHSGNSAIIDPWGNYVFKHENESNAIQINDLNYNTINEIRHKFPAFLDAD